MIKKLVLLLMLIAPISIFAQKFGHVNTANIIKVMPEYNKAQTDLQSLQKQYSEDLKRLESEFSKKNEEYKTQAETLPANIKARRESELQDLYTRLQQAAKDSETALQKASQEKFAVITEKISTALDAIGKEGGYIYIFDLSSQTAPAFVNETLSTSLDAQLKAKLGLK